MKTRQSPGESADFPKPAAPTEDFFALRERVRSRFSGGSAVEDGSADWRRADPPEKLVQAIWRDLLFRLEGLRCLSGKPLEILDPGRWNGSAGPDFLSARLVMGGRPVKGDIEIHVRSSLWVRHEHHRDFAYNPVALHVFLDNDDGKSFDEAHNGAPIERFELRPALETDLDTLARLIQPEDLPYDSKVGLGLCHEYCTHEDEDLIRRFLAAGGRERMESKARLLAEQLQGDDFSQALYQSLMTAMGSKGNKALFFLLSKRAPLGELIDHAADARELERAERIQAVLLHVGGLAPSRDAAEAHHDPPTVEYLNRINRHWAELCGYFADRLIPPTKRWRQSMRPVNFPSRRLAGIAHIVSKARRGRDYFRMVAERVRLTIPGSTAPRSMRAFQKGVEDLFTVDAPGDYWSRRYTLQAGPAETPLSLIGRSRARSIVFNSLLPLLLLHARRARDEAFEGFLWRWHQRFPSLESNNVTRFMRHRLFGDHERGKTLLDGEPMQQGLFQVFHSCCNNRERDCAACYFLHDGAHPG